MTRKDDLRYIRTEDSIRDTFFELVQEKRVASITVSEICRRAGISRNAFYLHYAGVAALYTGLVDEVVFDIRTESLLSSERSAATGHDDALSDAIVRTLAKHEETLRALLPSDDGSLAQYLAKGLEEAFIEGALFFGKHGASLDHRLRCVYTAWGIVGLLTCWLSETDRPISDAGPRFEELFASCIEASSAYLVGAMPNGK